MPGVDAGIGWMSDAADINNEETATFVSVETPIVCSYFAVEDISKAVNDAEAAESGYRLSANQTGGTGTWAICMLDGI